MSTGPEERWRELCEQAMKEHDLEKVLGLVNEINNLLEAGEQPKPKDNEEPYE